MTGAPAGPPIGPRGLAVRCAAQGLEAARAGAPLTACPYPTLERPYSRRAWVRGYVAHLRDTGTPLPSQVAQRTEEDAPAPS